jgi:hypothetical protein
VFLINAVYSPPKLTAGKAVSAIVNGWSIGGQIVAESGQPYSVYDYEGSVASLYYSSNDEITNPLVPLAPGVTANQAKLQGTLGVNPNNPVLNAASFLPQFVTPGQDGVPAGDIYESVFGNIGRNIFRGPFQSKVDVSLARQFQVGERMHLRFSAEAFNLFNHPDFDTPNNDVQFFSGYDPPLLATPNGSLGMIQHTIGSPRFLQLDAHLTF